MAIAAATSAFDLAAALRAARERTLACIADLSDAALRVPMLAGVNPILWEVGHVAYFAELWTLRRLYGREPIVAGADRLYDSATVAHDDRWELNLPDRTETLAFLDRQLSDVLGLLSGTDLSAASAYLHRLALHHEDMHGEALLYTRDGLEYPRPPLAFLDAPRGGVRRDDAQVPGGIYRIGARPQDPFVFDNEKWEHDVAVAAYAIARATVTNGEYAAFVESGGYRERRHWSDRGWAWRERAGAEHPLHWRRRGDRWAQRHFDAWRDLPPRAAVVHVNYYEAEAYCAYAGRRLPTEAEWEIAATGGMRRRYPWGDEPPDPGRANLDAWYGDVADVAAFETGDSPFGVRQMLGNVWEWTSSAFTPYPGFAPDPYREYSEPWFGDHLVLRGGAWSTRAHMITTRWRNFYKPERRDIFTGLRTCAL